MSESKRMRRSGGLRLRRLALKELRETLRDRRTIITLFAMPLLVYPILSLIFRTFLFSTLMSGTSDGLVKFTYSIESELENEKIMAIRDEVFKVSERFINPPENDASPEPEANLEDPANEDSQSTKPAVPFIASGGGAEIAPFMEHKWTRMAKDPEKPATTLEELVQSGEADIGLRFNVRKAERRGFGYNIEIIQNEDRVNSRMAARILKERLEIFNREELRKRLQLLRVRTDMPFEVAESKVVSLTPPKQPLSFAALIPLMLVLMTITGAVYPAIDLTAGERERGTLETLVAAPIPRISILISKFIAVLTVAVLTATLNVAGILVTIWAFQLESMLGGGGLTWPMIAKVFALLILFAGFFSALLLAVTSYARSFKEAQAYLIPIILLSLAPGLMALTPGLSLNGPLAVAPMVNILLLARDVLQGTAELFPALIAVISTVLYGFVAILIAAKIFGTDAILYGSSGSWKDLLTRPSEPQILVPMPTVITCLAMLFPANFVLIGYLGRFEGPLATRLMLMGLFTFMTFMAFPYLVSAFQRVKVSTGFGFRLPPAKFLLIAFVFGCSLWPIVMSIITGWQYALEFFQGAAESQAWHDRLIEFGKAQAASLREINPVIIAVTFAFLPALCEEWFFRGFLLRSLLKDRSAWLAIMISAIVFGLFHVLSNSVVAMDRLLPTTLVGVVLGWLCYRSGSIVPGIIMHMLHNGIVIFLAYYQPQLSGYSWFPEEGAPIPLTWIAVSAIISLGCILALQLMTGAPNRVEADLADNT